MLRDLLSLTKPRIAALLCLTGTGATFAAGGLPLAELVVFVLAGLGMAGGAAACNCYYDRDIDPVMDRTADRPLARGTLAPRTALAFGVGLLAAATGLGLWALPLQSVVYMWLGVAAYVGLYTVLLKRRHWLGVVLGGSAGSFPVLAGWTAIRPLSAAAVVMATLVFVWTPAHAWALAVVYRDEFAAAGVATLPAVTSLDRVRRAVWASALGTVAVAALLVPLAGPVYAGTLAAGVPLFLVAYRAYHRGGGEPRAVRAFFTSNTFLAVAFVAWGVDGVVALEPTAAYLVAAAATVTAFVGCWIARPSLDGVRASPPPTWVRRAVRAYDRLRVRVTG
ncbi:protoheme IX farnesyltransferase [Haloplanus aerogenes]|uniref:Protoheme IX farnesyltransferase n=1 Tax=Haloplanus aerogenes TaxID=660522 RepID=A0A3M0CW31_9EURY|nr:UbiA family prenyltransferase [Haloplanus aerogenes]AZH27025.1 protoheme IX farnesyltransferase [Haloplanus aerogenes]RMB13482.1 protoheme IX farnesyltransferase [Haloplanus aerogenes]